MNHTPLVGAALAAMSLASFARTDSGPCSTAVARTGAIPAGPHPAGMAPFFGVWGAQPQQSARQRLATFPYALAAQNAAPTGPSIASLTLPLSFEDRLLYYASFDDGDATPEFDETKAQTVLSPSVGDAGFIGGGALPEKDRLLQLRGECFSPHKPLTVSFWWALGEDERIDGSFGLFHLAGGAGFVSHFSRGKGEWCALERPVGILQVYYLPGIQNVNGIYDRDLAAHYDLRAGVWHHTAVVFRGASLVEVYTDGELAWKTRNKGRPFSADDKLHDLTIGSRWGIQIAFDEVVILRRSLTPTEIRNYVTAIRQMREVGYPF